MWEQLCLAVSVSEDLSSFTTSNHQHSVELVKNRIEGSGYRIEGSGYRIADCELPTSADLIYLEHNSTHSACSS